MRFPPQTCCRICRVANIKGRVLDRSELRHGLKRTRVVTSLVLHSATQGRKAHLGGFYDSTDS
jgi:hypothetical protein